MARVKTPFADAAPGTKELFGTEVGYMPERLLINQGGISDYKRAHAQDCNDWQKENRL